MTQSAKIQRHKELLKWFIEKYAPICYFCRSPIKSDSLFPRISGKKHDDYTIHHVDQNRTNNSPSNLEICHRGCHRQWHINNPKIFESFTGDY